MGFLPQSYEVPQTGHYMKLAQGKNRFRVLGPAIVGNLFWRSKGDGREPVRRRMHEPILANELEYNSKDGKPEVVKHFWAFPVWNYAAKAVQILEVTQKSIMGAMQALVDEEEWGDPVNYDIVVTRSGNGLDTEYAVQPLPGRPLDSGIMEGFQAAPPNIEALFSGGDPFASIAPPPQAGAVAPQTTPAPAPAALNRAKRAYRTKYPNVPNDELAEGFRQRFKACFPGRTIEMATATDWDAFVAMDFMKPMPVNPISDERQFSDDPSHPDFIPF